MSKLSPGMQQYVDIKEQYKDCIVFYRLGDFYEFFFEDALITSKELELTLTAKSCGLEEKAPMCGVPYHAADSYIQRMVEKGYKVAICEQTEDPAKAKGLVKREVIQIITPGTITSSSMLKENKNNYIASIFISENGDAMSVAYSDISTGELYLTEYRGNDIFETLLNEIVKIKPSEIIMSEDFVDKYPLDELKHISEAFFDILPETYYNEKSCEEAVLSQFNTISLTGLGLDFRPTATVALGVLLSYLLETQKQKIQSITNISFYEIGMHMALDKATIRNLEITETLYEKTVKGSLLGVLDKCHTAMGSRKLTKWLREPLNNSIEINRRLEGVEELYTALLMRNNIKESLKQIYDFERLIGRASYGNANARDLIALKNSIAVLPDIKSELTAAHSTILNEINDDIDELHDVFELIERAITEDVGFTVKEGGLIKDGYSEELDNLKNSIKGGKEWISSLEQKERDRTGIKTLKVGFNSVFGYYLEVTKAQTAFVPEDYIRKQTLVNAERYITPELKEMESIVLSAESKINQMEYDLFCEIREYIKGYTEIIQRTSRAISTLDVLCSFAHVSDKLGYVRPVVDDGLEISIVKGKHPVIEQTISNGLFVANDTYINTENSSMLLITGPNMSGKSTYMRQTALIVLMAQTGCFVPCESARIGVCDRIFTRIGASDNLSQGQSTFFVEMSELSYILGNAKERSLIILDEIGRGTSTYDGLSIAWAVVEYLCKEDKRIRTLFATHYHELTALEGQIDGVKNLNVDVAEEGGNIVFLHKIVEGSASRSYGIHVAKIAGIPKSLLERAEQKLAELESSGSDDSSSDIPMNMTSKSVKSENTAETREQLSLFDLTPDPIIKRLRDIDLMNVTPSEAIKILEELKSKL